MADDRETGQTLKIKFDEKGLVPGLVQDADTGQMLMMAWMNETALQQTLTQRKATFYSRSRDKVWVKGESSGHIMELVEARVDCDQDVVLLRCRAKGPACHVGYQTCFYRAIDGENPEQLTFVEDQAFDPDAVY
jgi:phosphoribosyl-AMP cyclohydrolase